MQLTTALKKGVFRVPNTQPFLHEEVVISNREMCNSRMCHWSVGIPRNMV